jgi:hypothetical protein
MCEESWKYKGCIVTEGPAAGQPVEPFTYVFRVQKGGAPVCAYTIVSDRAAIQARWPDIDPARVGDVDVLWGALSGEGYARVRALIDSGAPVDKTLTLHGMEAVES